jgi:hypothetical protein
MGLSVRWSSIWVPRSPIYQTFRTSSEILGGKAHIYRPSEKGGRRMGPPKSGSASRATAWDPVNGSHERVPFRGAYPPPLTPRAGRENLAPCAMRPSRRACGTEAWATGRRARRHGLQAAGHGRPTIARQGAHRPPGMGCCPVALLPVNSQDFPGAWEWRMACGQYMPYSITCPLSNY